MGDGSVTVAAIQIQLGFASDGAAQACQSWKGEGEKTWCPGRSSREIVTCQNHGGLTRGLECSEERQEQGPETEPPQGDGPPWFG